MQKLDTQATQAKADSWMHSAVGSAQDRIGDEAMERHDPKTEDVICVQQIHPAAALVLDRIAAAPGFADDANEIASFFPQLYHARFPPCSMISASTASWSPAPAT